MITDKQRRCCIPRIIGQMPYIEAWDLQRSIVDRIKEGDPNDYLLLLEHPPVFTIGRNGKDDHLLNPALVERLGAEVHHTDRGGDITYHGPGQVVGYPILNLRRYKCDIRWYANRIEEVMIRVADVYGIAATRSPGLTGIWVGNDKLGAFGARISKWVTSHGFAFNANTDLDYFKLIVPCGIRDKGVTSLSRILGHPIDQTELQEQIIKSFADVFECAIIEESIHA